MPKCHYGHIRSPSLRNVCFDEGDADKENTIQDSKEESLGTLEKGIGEG